MPKSAWLDLGNGRKRHIPDIDAYLAKHKDARSARSTLAMPMLIRDTMQPLINHADGKIYDSVSAFKKGVKEAGKRTGRELEIVGNDPSFGKAAALEYKPDPTLKQSIKDAYDKVVGV